MFPGRLHVAIGLWALLTVAGHTVADVVKVRGLYTLSDFTGAVPYRGGRLVAGSHGDEIFVLASNQVRIFNRTGMETYRFRHGPESGLVRDLAIDDSGDILVLSHDPTRTGPTPFRLTRCDYRGIAKAPVEVHGLPEAFAAIRPDRIFHRDARLHLASRNQKLAVEVDARTGEFQRGFDLAELLLIPEEERAGKSIVGYDLDQAGNLLITIPSLFRAYVISPEGEVASFGQPGSTPGSFGVIAGIATDGRGHYFVADRGRSVVMIFDDRFEFLSEFGGRGESQDNLVRPSGLAVDGSGRLFITQLRNRGVAAFSLSFE
jgi:hypothetical protein